MEIPVLFENEHFLVVDKPAGMLSVPSRMGEEDERPCVGRLLEKEKGFRLWPVHRLDVEVSGILLFAKAAEAHAKASSWFEHREVIKTYEALTEAKPGATPAIGTKQRWESMLLRGKKRAYEKPFGKKSITDVVYEGKGSFQAGEVHRWKIFPQTGRPHQIRYELGKHGFPVVGDELYGSTRKAEGEGILLRAVGLDLSKIAERFALPEKFVLPGFSLEK